MLSTEANSSDRGSLGEGEGGLSASTLQLTGSRVLCVRVKYFLLWSMSLEVCSSMAVACYKLNS